MTSNTSLPARPAGLVLAGGRSSRFGAEKAVQSLAGRTLMEWSLAALSAVCGEVAVSAATGSAAVLAQSLGRTVLVDDPAHADGPLAGVAAGLAWAAAQGAAQLVTLPCDTPAVTGAILAQLLEAAGGGGGFAATADGPQNLCAVWPVTALAGLRAAMHDGGHPSVRDALSAAGCRAVPFDDPAAFANINTPDDLAALGKSVV
jgi:molybdopterin-guanine dinucleotide biosynthesis protein A